MKKRANSYNTGIAAEYFILSQLYRMGIEAYVSQGNKKAIDIRIIKENGDSISVDVKAVRDYSSFIVNNIAERKNHFIVFVAYNKKIEKLKTFPEIFIVPSYNINSIVEKYKKERRILKNGLTKNNYKDRWDLLS